MNEKNPEDMTKEELIALIELKYAEFKPLFKVLNLKYPVDINHEYGISLKGTVRQFRLQ